MEMRYGGQRDYSAMPRGDSAMSKKHLDSVTADSYRVGYRFRELEQALVSD